MVSWARLSEDSQAPEMFAGGTGSSWSCPPLLWAQCGVGVAPRATARPGDPGIPCLPAGGPGTSLAGVGCAGCRVRCRVIQPLLPWLLSASPWREERLVGAVGFTHQALIHLLPVPLHPSDARENSQRITDRLKFGDSGHGAEDSKADQAANEWGRSGKDPNHFRPAGLPDKY